MANRKRTKNKKCRAQTNDPMEAGSWQVGVIEPESGAVVESGDQVDDGKGAFIVLVRAAVGADLLFKRSAVCLKMAMS